MKELIKVVHGNVEMTSRDIAEWFDKRHDHVLRDIKKECKACGINIKEDNPYFGESYYMNIQNKKQPQIQLSKKGILLIGARYSSKLRLALIEKIEELEKQKQENMSTLEMLEKMVAYEKEKQLLLTENNELVKTKAYINNKKTATAMNTASQLSKENKKLKIKLDETTAYATITAVQKYTDGNISWRKLKSYCQAKELDIKKVHDDRYGQVNSYPAEAWLKVYGVDLKELF